MAETFERIPLRKLAGKGAKHIQELQKKALNYALLKKSVLLYPTFILYGISIILLLKLAQVLLG